MTIKAYCPGCDKTYQVKDSLAGKRAKCPQGHVLLIPNADLSPQDPPQQKTTASTRSQQKHLSNPTAKSPIMGNQKILIFASIGGGLALVLLIVAIYSFVSRPGKKGGEVAAVEKNQLQGDQPKTEQKEKGGAALKSKEDEAKGLADEAAKKKQDEEKIKSASDAAKAWAKQTLVVTNPRDNLIKRSEKIKDDRRFSDTIKAWHEALQEKSGDRADATNFLLFFINFGPVFENHVFQPERSDKYVQRIKSLPADAITAWEELVNQVAEEQFNKNAAIINLIQIDRLFRVAEFNRAEFDLLKARARALPADSTKTLAETLYLGTKREQAFVELLTQDWLYRRDGSFNQDIFREALGYVRVQQK